MTSCYQLVDGADTTDVTVASVTYTDIGLMDTDYEYDVGYLLILCLFCYYMTMTINRMYIVS